MKKNTLPMLSLTAVLVCLGSCGGSPGALMSIRGDKAAYIGTVPFEAPLFYQKGTEMVGPDAELATRIVANIKSALSEPGDEREVTLWNKRIMSTDPLTLGEVGDIFGFSRERARQIEARIKGRLKIRLIAEMGEEALAGLQLTS